METNYFAERYNILAFCKAARIHSFTHVSLFCLNIVLNGLKQYLASVFLALGHMYDMNRQQGFLKGQF